MKKEMTERDWSQLTRVLGELENKNNAVLFNGKAYHQGEGGELMEEILASAKIDPNSTNLGLTSSYIANTTSLKP